MVFETINERNTSQGLHVLFVYVSDIVPLFIPLLLTSIFLIVALSTFFAARRLGGPADITASFAAAAYLTAVVAIVLSLIPGLMDVITLVITLVIAVIATLWLFLSERQ